LIVDVYGDQASCMCYYVKEYTSCVSEKSVYAPLCQAVHL